MKPFFLLMLLSALLPILAAQSSGGDFFKTRLMINPGKPGPWVTATRGKIWPKPQAEKPGGGTYSVLLPDKFMFLLTGDAEHCDLLQNAVNRYYLRTFPKRKGHLPWDESHPWYKGLNEDAKFRGTIDRAEIIMNNRRGCEKYPYLDMDEKYELKIDSPDQPNKIQIVAFSVWGILRGLESLSQLVYIAEEHGGMYQVDSTMVMDHPRFSHRGVMLDSSRHFLSKRVIFDNLDLMEMNKMNVFHWHLTDDNSFPYESLRFPNMSLKGAYRPYTHVYSQADVREIIEYARMRGIRVVAEFDTPGHTESWELGQPGLLAACYQGSNPNGMHGPMDPTKESVFDFLQAFFKEITTVFPDKYVHLGGDEVNLDCWRSNPKIRNYVQQNLKGDFRALESEFVQRLLNIIESYPTKNGYIVWQEVFDNKDKLKPDTVVEVWKGGESQWGREVAEVTRKGFRALLSAPWYLNYISYGSDWVKYYKADPHQFQGSDEQKKLVIGGEACLWGEFVNSMNLIPRLWPRASAVAERLWSAQSVRDPNAAAGRMQEHECRMMQRGYPVQPGNGAGFCDVLWD